MPDFTEVGDGVFVGRYPAMDLNVTAIRGSAGTVLVDPGGSPAEAAQVLADLRRLGRPELLAVINTHAHFDHTFGNQVFGRAELDVPIIGHHLLPRHLDTYERPRLAAWRDGRGDEPPRDWAEVTITPPSRLVTAVDRLDLGDRAVELVPLAPGHTDTDLVLHDPDTGVWIVGDVIEESGPPVYGSGCFPLSWADTVSGLLDRIGDTEAIVPGHGLPVDKSYGLAQRDEIAAVAGEIRRCRDASMTVEEALADARRWPFPVEQLGLAVQRGFEHLDRAERAP